jgi:putative Mg2+ transporter-C (MgtC) family protein
MVVSVLMSLEHVGRGYIGDPSRIATQIIPGIGFLGGGAIIQARGTVMGLTTAATIWCVAAIGVLVGMGFHDLAFALSVFTVTILVGISFFEDKVIGRSITFATELLIDDADGEVRQAINELLGQHDLSLESFEVSPKGDLSHIHMKYAGHRRDQKRFNLALWGAKGVKEVKHH